MKILVIMGSPRKGETYAAVQKVEAQMKTLGEVEFDYLWLKDTNLGQCRGCHACIRFGEQKCPLKNDRAEIEARMSAADGVILATPVYAQHVSALMKTMIDQFSFMWHRPRFFGKFAMGISSGGAQFKETLGYLKQNAKCWGFTWVTGLGVLHAESLVPKARQKLERETNKAAHEFYNTVLTGRTPGPTLFDLIWFRMWRINANAAKDYIPCDYQYWTDKGWFKQDYYTSHHINVAQRLFASFMEKFISKIMRSIYLGY